MTDQERIKYHAARRIWPMRDEMTPSGACTWRAWFEAKFGEPLDEYTERARRERLREQV